MLVVNQKTKLIELTNEYEVYDLHGQQIGAVVQVGQSTLKKAVRFVSNLDQFLTHRLEVRDATGVVAGPHPTGQVREEPGARSPAATACRSARSCRPTSSARSGSTWSPPVRSSVRIQAENWRAWDFAIVDAAGTEVARITKRWEGLARTLFTTADKYVVHVHFKLPEPLASMVIAAALTVDTALKQDDRGFN